MAPHYPEIAILIPCFDEEQSIGRVVKDFHQVLPEATIYVYDNASNDRTALVAREAGAVVNVEHRRGKGNVVRRMFADINADVFVMVDGDATYDPKSAVEMVDMLLDRQLDMVVGCRVPADSSSEVYRRGHTLGNSLFTGAVHALFGGGFTDVFSGYRAMSKRYVKTLPVRSSGFEIETELSAHAVRIAAPCAEIPTTYGSRGDDSNSKLHTYRDGAKIAYMMVKLFEDMRPFTFYGFFAIFLTLIALVLGIPVVAEFAQTGKVLRYPTAILAASIETVAFLCFTSGIILRSVGRTKEEIRRVAYLSITAPRGRRDPQGRWSLLD